MEVSWDAPIKSDSFIVVCKNAYLLHLHPFDSDIIQHKCYKRLNFIADQYVVKGQLREFTGYLLEGQYYINLLAAYFILDKFRPKKETKLIGLNDKVSIVEDCIETCDRYAQYFEKNTHIENYKVWIKGIKDYYSLRSTGKS